MKVFLARFLLLFALAALVSGSVRKKEDPVAATAQTGPISLKQKLEEEKDGVKGAPSPSMTFYGHNKFLTTPAVNDKAAEEGPEELDPAESGWEPDFPAGSEGNKIPIEEEDSWWSEGDEESFSDASPSKPAS
jgi:hypothetical protein